MSVHMAYQGDYLVDVLLISQQLLVNISHARFIVQSRVKKYVFDKLNSKRSVGECIDKHKQGTENVEQILDHQAEQQVLHREHKCICVWN